MGGEQTFYVTSIKVKGKGERVKPASIQEVSMNTSQINKMLYFGGIDHSNRNSLVESGLERRSKGLPKLSFKIVI